jgi:hypothetical protein
MPNYELVKIGETLNIERPLVSYQIKLCRSKATSIITDQICSFVPKWVIVTRFLLREKVGVQT